MRTQPHVDVILATNRSSPYLRAALESLRAQTWQDWRLILVDDGSPDHQFIRSEASRVAGATVLRQDPRGVSAARNLGLRHATGDLVAFLDDDDVWSPQKLLRQVQAWLADPAAVAVYCAGHYIGADGEPLGTSWPATAGTPEQFLSGEVPLPRIVTLVARRDACDAIGGFDEGLDLFEDTDLMMRLVRQGPFAAVAQDMVAYRRHPASVSQTSPSHSGRVGERMLRWQINDAVGRGDEPTARLLRRNLKGFHQSYARESSAAAIGAVRSGHPRVAVRELSWALRRAPGATIAVAVNRALVRLPLGARRQGDP